jgi:hypothetical protein
MADDPERPIFDYSSLPPYADESHHGMPEKKVSTFGMGCALVWIIILCAVVMIPVLWLIYRLICPFCGASAGNAH